MLGWVSSGSILWRACQLVAQDAAPIAAAQRPGSMQQKPAPPCVTPNLEATQDSALPVRGLPVVSVAPWQARLPTPAPAIRKRYRVIHARNLRPWSLLPAHGRHTHARAPRAWPAPEAVRGDGTSTRMWPHWPAPASMRPAA